MVNTSPSEDVTDRHLYRPVPPVGTLISRQPDPTRAGALQSDPGLELNVGRANPGPSSYATSSTKIGAFIRTATQQKREKHHETTQKLVFSPAAGWRLQVVSPFPCSEPRPLRALHGNKYPSGSKYIAHDIITASQHDRRTKCLFHH